MGSIHEGVLYWTQWICSFLIKKNNTSKQPPLQNAFYDIGAYEGLFGKAITALDMPVYAWEVHPEYARALRSSVSFPVFSVGLGNADGEMMLYQYSDASFNSLYQRSAGDLAQYNLEVLEGIPVDIRTLDKMQQEKKLRLPLCMKIDVEGAELSILEGAVHVLKTATPVIIYEQSFENTKNAGYTREKLREFLADFGYQFFGIERGRTDLLSSDCDQRSVWNVIAIHKTDTALLDAVLPYVQ